MRTAEDSGVNKHYDLEDAAQLDVVLSDLIGLLRDGTRPVGRIYIRETVTSRSSAGPCAASVT
jgi:hypothetical protein